jgi:hypothetical protein
MPVEIEKPFVSFTEEAQRVLQHSVTRLERRIRAKAADNAIKSRGTPSEVTGSDVEKAYREILGSNLPQGFSGRTLRELRVRRKTSSLRFISTLYVWFGVLIAVCGGIYPFIRVKMLDPTVRFSVLAAVSGLIVALLGVVFKAYLNYHDVVRKEEIPRKYPVFDVYRRSE